VQPLIAPARFVSVNMISGVGVGVALEFEPAVTLGTPLPVGILAAVPAGLKGEF
jgi:hypothetical protein